MKLSVVCFTVVAGLVTSLAFGGCDRSHSTAALVDVASAGKQATLVSVVENAGSDGDGWISAWVLTHGDDVCCIWETDSNKPSSLLARKCAPKE
jgi:hypothetical protein